MASQIPLPAGWEAKFDPGQNRYFFINHSTKQTTWEDPRYHQPKQPAQPTWQEASPYLGRGQSRSPRQSTENIAMQDMNVPKWKKDIENKYNIKVSTMGSEGAEEEEEAHHKPVNKHNVKEPVEGDIVSNLKQLFPTAEDWAIRNTLFKCNNDEARAISRLEELGYHKQSAQSQLKENNLVNKLKREFPTAEDGVIRDVIQCVDQNETRSRQELKALGYKHNSVHDVAPAQPSPKKKTSSTSLSVTNRASPAKSTSSTSQVEPSDAEKERIKKKITGEFPSYTPSTINIILNSTKYNEDKARKLLDTMSKQKPAQKKAEKKPSKEHAASPSKPFPWETTSASTSATSVAFTMPDFNIPTPSYSSSSGKGKKTSSGSVSGSHSKPSPAKHATKQKPTGSRHTARTRQPVRTEYVSSNRTAAIGPDASLAKGPDIDLLIDDYAPLKGPDLEICKGPNCGLVEGSTLAVGPDPTLTMGQDPSIRCGANPDLAEYMRYTRKPPLVTPL